VQDYGGPVGFRIVTRHPDWLEWLIVQELQRLRGRVHPLLGRPAPRILEAADA
jgi:hypothetical protein